MSLFPLCKQGHQWTRRRPFSVAVAVAAIAGTTILVPVTAAAALGVSYTVNSCGDSGTGSGTAGDLLYVVTQTNLSSGDAINFSVNCPATSPITLTSTIDINTNLTIDGPGASDLVVSGNNAVEVFDIASGVTASISGLTIENGFATGGGGIWNNGTLTLTDSTVSGDTASFQGGAGVLNIGTLTVTDSTVSGNSTADGNGGGIFNGYTHTLTVSGSDVSGNSASEGGGIDNDEGTLNVTASTLSGNSSSFGGGIFNFIGPMTVTNSTLSGNTAVEGGGIFNEQSDATVTNSTVTNSTLSGNTSQAGGGGGIYSSGSLVATLSATIVANSGSGLDCVNGNSLTLPAVADGGYNLDDDGSCGFGGTSLSDTAARLDPAGLQNNGGPTQTIALEPGSPAIGHVTDPAECPATDQRGDARTVPCDIGAFELLVAPAFTAASPPLTVLAGQSYAYTFAASGFPAPSYSLGAGAPSWLSINASTGALSGTVPTNISSFSYSVTASNSVGNPATAGPFTITVIPVVSLAFSGSLTYTNSGPITSGSLRVSPSTGTITSVTGTITIPGLSGGSARVSVAIVRLFGLYSGVVSVSDPGAHLGTTATVFSKALTRTANGGVTGTASGLSGRRLYTLVFTI